MTDINEQLRDRDDISTPETHVPRGAKDGENREQDLLEIAELLFFAYRDFTGDPDKILDDYGFGRAHHRVLHFVNRHPGMRVADLLDILKITKQSLGRVLKQLVDEGFIIQKAGKTDRRERLLYATDKGSSLAEELAGPQVKRIASALKGCEDDADARVREFLFRMIREKDRAGIEKLLTGRKQKDQRAQHQSH